MTVLPPKSPSRPDKVSLWRYIRLFRQDILSAQPARLYRARMAAFKTPFFRSFLINQPDLINEVLKQRPDEFPKSARISEGLRPLLGNSVFLTNGEVWKRQRRIIDPAFEGGRLRKTWPAMYSAAEAVVARLNADPRVAGGEPLEIEVEASHVAADVIFRTLFSIPIEHDVACEVFTRFRDYQRSQPILNLAAFVPLPTWAPRMFRPKTRRAASDIRKLIGKLTAERRKAIETGAAPNDLATKIMTTRDPETGEIFTTAEMVDQVAIFFLAGHETSASALAWALYLMALYPEWQEKLASEAQALQTGVFAELSALKLSKDVFRETLRLYPPVPMLVRENQCPERFRDRDIRAWSQVVISPWHLHRHERIWENPDGFDPTRWKTANGRKCLREAWIPFSTGPRVCPGAGFAMAEGPLILSMILKHFRITRVEGRTPVPVAHLTVRAKDGIWLKLEKRRVDQAEPEASAR